MPRREKKTKGFWRRDRARIHAWPEICPRAPGAAGGTEKVSSMPNVRDTGTPEKTVLWAGWGLKGAAGGAVKGDNLLEAWQGDLHAKLVL